jgi:hypothetical protein
MSEIFQQPAQMPTGPDSFKEEGCLFLGYLPVCPIRHERTRQEVISPV